MDLHALGVLPGLGWFHYTAGAYIAFIVHICSKEVLHPSSKSSYACIIFKENIKLNYAAPAF